MKLYKMRFCFHKYRTLGHRLATASDSDVDSILHHFEKRCGNSSPHCGAGSDQLHKIILHLEVLEEQAWLERLMVG